MKPLRPFAPFLLVALFFCGGSARANEVIEDQWHVVLSGEDRIGYMHTTVTQKDDGGPITSTQDVKLVMARAGTEIELEIGSSFVETPDGQPVRATSRLNMGGEPVVTRVVFKPEHIEVMSGQSGRMTTTRQPPIEGDWMTPRALNRYLEAQLVAGADTIVASTVDVAAGLKPVGTRMVRVGPEDVEVYGKTVPATAWDVTVSSLPGVTLRDYLSDEGKSIKSTIPLLPGLELTVLEADKDLALSKLTPAEMMAQTFVVPNRKIERPRELTRAVYQLKTRGGDALPALPQLGVQEYDPAGRVSVDMSRVADEPIEAERFLRASAVLNHEAPAVRAWLEPLQRVRLAGGQAATAEFLRQEVHQNIRTKDLSVGFATASDVACTKQGDCTEHAVLLAALLRGAGIPSRCVSGLVYADQFAGHKGIFGYHMWTQAWIKTEKHAGEFGGGGGRWVDFDATLPDGVRFDATHIALSVSDMNDGLVGNDMAALLPLLGNLEIEVVHTGYGDAAGDR